MASYQNSYFTSNDQRTFLKTITDGQVSWILQKLLLKAINKNLNRSRLTFIHILFYNYLVKKIVSPTLIKGGYNGYI